MNVRVLGAGGNCPGGGNVRGDYVRWGNVEGGMYYAGLDELEQLSRIFIIYQGVAGRNKV